MSAWTEKQEQEQEQEQELELELEQEQEKKQPDAGRPHKKGRRDVKQTKELKRMSLRLSKNTLAEGSDWKPSTSC
jgi:hypothetical protein